MMRVLALLVVAITPFLSSDARSEYTEFQCGGVPWQLIAHEFRTLSLVCDSGATPLAAWQLEMVLVDAQTGVVGVEAGDSPAYPDPPTYSLRAGAEGRFALAAYSLADELPSGRTRVATLHVASNTPEPRILLGKAVACDREGRRIPVTFELVP